MKWITRERPKIDRIACPWLILRFIEPDAEFLYVPAERVLLDWTSRRSAQVCTPFPSDCRTHFPMTTTCCVTVLSYTTRCTRGATGCRTRLTTGRPRATHWLPNS